ncbi:MAG TPA: hypothetical protein EYG21_00230 [Nitrospinaceae bacterium]|nr:hypothetical protein [Nitrospinaceae bacterium]
METRIEAIKAKGLASGVLNDWERSFLDSLIQQSAKRSLTVKQNNWLQKIEAKINDAEDPEWEKNWSPTQERYLKIAIEYYKSQTPLYFGSIIHWVEANPTKIINKVNYQKIVENKYAKKVIKALVDKPKYDAGQAVTLRANASRMGLPPSLFHSSSQMLFVLEPLDQAISPAAGARLYLVLPSDSAKTYKIEERWLKKYPKKA